MTPNHRILACALVALGLLTGSPAHAVPIEDARIVFSGKWSSSEVELIEESVLLDETIVNPDNSSFFYTGFSEIAGGAIRSSLQGNFFSATISSAVRDTYSVHGVTPREPVQLTVRLDIDGLVTATRPGSFQVVGKIGGDLPTDVVNQLPVPSPLISPFGVKSQDIFQFVGTPGTVPVHLPVETTLDVLVGDTFTLAYQHSLFFVGDEMLLDFTNTATVDFDLPAGITLTSTNGFGTAVPEPTTLALASAGLLGLLGFGSRRRRVRHGFRSIAS